MRMSDVARVLAEANTANGKRLTLVARLANSALEPTSPRRRVRNEGFRSARRVFAAQRLGRWADR
jgi:hypothetical protein